MHPNYRQSTLVYVPSDVTHLLEEMRAGDESALNELVTVLYRELRHIATRHLCGERPAHTLQTTALVHEAYLKLLGEESREFANRTHFLAVASRVMRQVLVDYARARAAKKRSGGAQAGLEPEEYPAAIQLERRPGIGRIELLDLDAALDALAREDRPLAQLIEMRYFGGMTAEETADALGQSVHVVRHDLRLAQACLRRKLGVR
ncbi:MAG: ECF-type sigma factor [Bryobacteraceae bacterium]